ncbi:MAG: hypothetical protein GZ087_03445 [Flavobacterium sp.]|nr:hypothetical protein [Flavobacterium sp.]
MKNLSSQTENIWKERLTPNYTEEQETLLKSRLSTDRLAQKELRDSIIVSADEADATNAQSVYETIKPSLLEEDEYQLVSVDVSLDGASGSGIINCRINGEHKQIRF